MGGDEGVAVRRIVLLLNSRYFNEEDLTKVFTALASEYSEPDLLSIDAHTDQKEASEEIRAALSNVIIDVGASTDREGAAPSLSAAGRIDSSLRAEYSRMQGEEVFHYEDPTTQEYRTITIKSKTIQYTENISTDLLLAAQEGDISKIRSILASYADSRVSAKTKSIAILRAALNGHDDVVRILLKEAIDVRTQTEGGWTLLMIEASRGDLEIVQQLLNMGAEVNVKDPNGNSALLSAAYKGHVQIVKVLLDNGAKVDAKDNSGVTSLMEAAATGNSEIVKELLARGANVNLKSDGGKTALIVARERNQVAVADLLKKAGAKE
ncbi:MAG: ankyrin repeat domain-containing protein [Acidobacteriota bacterium]